MPTNKTTEMTVEQGNRLIAEFDDMVLHTGDPDYGEVYYNKYDKYKINRYPLHDLKYHSSWDWLMPVVEKINDLAIDNYGEMGVFIFPNNVVIGESSSDPLTMCTIANHKSLIQMTWTAIVTFIHFYNTQTPTT